MGLNNWINRHIFDVEDSIPAMVVTPIIVALVVVAILIAVVEGIIQAPKKIINFIKSFKNLTQL